MKNRTKKITLLLIAFFGISMMMPALELGRNSYTLQYHHQWDVTSIITFRSPTNVNESIQTSSIPSDTADHAIAKCFLLSNNGNTRMTFSFSWDSLKHTANGTMNIPYGMKFYVDEYLNGEYAPNVQDKRTRSFS